MTEHWREIVVADGQLPAPLADALMLAQYRAHGSRLPVVLMGDAVIMAADDFGKWFARMPVAQQQQRNGENRR